MLAGENQDLTISPLHGLVKETLGEKATDAGHDRHEAGVRVPHPSSQLVVATLLRGHVEHRRGHIHSHQLSRVVLEPAADETRTAPEVQDGERAVEVREHVTVVAGLDFLGEGLKGGVVDLLHVLRGGKGYAGRRRRREDEKSRSHNYNLVTAVDEMTR